MGIKRFSQVLFVVALTNCSKVEKVKKYHPNGNLNIEGQTISGLKQGEWKYYKDDGQLSFKQFFNRDTLKRDETYSNGILGTSKDVKYYKNDTIKHIVTYFPNGDIETKGKTVNNVYEGESIGYHENGVVGAIAHYKNSDLAGEYVQYYPDGSKRMFTKEIGNSIHEFYDSLNPIAYHVLFKDFQIVDTVAIRNLTDEDEKLN